jgi:fumarate reductase subunit D
VHPGRTPQREHQLGVLLVHGIGTQRSGDTLVRWGDVLLKTIRRATRDRVAATVERASPDSGGPGRDGAEAVVLLRAGGREERWLLSEGLWADTFVAPSYGELVSWSLRALPWAIAIHIGQRYWHAAEQRGTRRKVVAAATSVIQLSVALALAPVLILLLGLVLPFGLIPIPQLRAAILAAQSTLTATVGDSLAFVESPVRAALIRTRIIDGLRRLKQHCERTIIVAHSQGAAVVLEALGGIPGRPVKQDPSAPTVVPDALVTFGAGTNQLASLKALSGELLSKMKVDPVWYAVAALLVVTGLSAWLWVQVSNEQLSGKDIAHAAGLYLLLMLVLGLTIPAVIELTSVLARRWRLVHEHAEGIKTGTSGALFLAGMVLAITYADRAELPLVAMTVLGGALTMWLGSIRMILSKDLKTLLTSVRTPPGLARWTDLYASADPVSNGPTLTDETATLESVPIWNEGSFLADHAAYWDNLDGFVLRVVRVCADTARSPWRAELPPERPELDKRADWRATWLRMTRHSLVLIWLFVGAMLLILPGMDVPLPDRVLGLLPDWLPALTATPMRSVLLVALTTVAAWASYGIARWVWRRWVRAEQEAVLAHDPPRGGEFVPLCAMGMVVWAVLLLAILLAGGAESELPKLLTNPGEMLLALVMILGFAWPSTYALLKLNPAPRATERPAEAGASPQAGAAG